MDQLTKTIQTYEALSKNKYQILIEDGTVINLRFKKENTEKLVIYITLKIFYNANRIAEAVSRVAIRRYISSKQGDNRYEEENNYNLAGNNYVYRMPYWK